MPQKAALKKKNDQPIIVQQLNQLSVDRTPKDVASFRHAHRMAEQINTPNRTRLYDLYSDVELDTHLSGCIEKRTSSVLNKRLVFKKDGKEVAEVADLIKSNEFREVIKLIMGSLWWGIKGIEFIPGPVFAFEEIPNKHIRPDKKLLVVNQSDQEGIPYEPISNVWIIGQPKNLGLYLKASFYALIKKGNAADWAAYSEIFGQPVIIAKYDAYDDNARLQLQEVMQNAGGSLRLQIPKQADFDIVDGKSANGDGQLQNRLHTACNDELSVLILGNTETTSSSHGGSNAKAREHSEQQDEITKSDLVFVENTLNSERFLNILYSYGYPITGGRFKIELEANITHLEKRISIDERLARLVPIDDDYFYNTYSLPKPANYEAIKKKQEEVPPRPRIDNTTSHGENTTKNLSALEALLNTVKSTFNQLSGFVKNKKKALPAGVLVKDLTSAIAQLYGSAVADLPDLVENEDTELFRLCMLMLEQVWIDKGLPDGTVDSSVVSAFAQKLWQGVTEGYGQDIGSVAYDTPDHNMLTALQKNTWQFAQAKNYTQLRQLTDALIDERGVLRSFEEFKIAAMQINANHIGWQLGAEYNLAVAGGQMAGKWVEIQKNKAALPLLRYDAVLDGQTTGLCRSLDGVTLPVDHPFWSIRYPPNHFGCRSSVRQLASGVVTPENEIPAFDTPKMFETNLAQQGLVFPKNHPYFVR